MENSADLTSPVSAPKAPILTTDETPNVSITSFSELDLNEKVMEAIAKIGWTKPTPVQGLCLPWTIQGRDVAGFAQTGTGKTGVFLISIAQQLLKKEADPERKSPRAIVIAPTRELAVQIEDDAQPLLNPLGLKSLAVYGGVDYEKQARAIKDGIDVIVATPGRLKDYCQKNVVNLKEVEVFVCDEADRMFDMGFIDDVEYFLSQIPVHCQKLLFSATTSPHVKELAFEYLENPEYISVNPEILTPEKIEMHAVHVNAEQKLKVMLGLLAEHKPECAIVFTNTKLTAEWLHFKLEGNGIQCDLITGDLPQKKRIGLIHKIKEGKLSALIATDVASRGLHISRVSHVYNFDLPEEPANYIHRVGRTARAGAKGHAFSLVCDDYGHNLQDINKLLGPELALSSTWYDEAYLKIEDKAGNPFSDENRAARESSEDRPGAYSRDGGGRDSGRDRGGRDRGGRDRKPQDAGRRPQEGDRQGGGRGNERGRGRGQGRGPKPNQANRPQHDRNQNRDRNQGRPDKQVAAASKAVPEQPKSTIGLFKKFVKTLFGKK